MRNPRARSKQPKHKDPDAAYIAANVTDPESAARLLTRVLALKRLLARLNCDTRVTPSTCNSLINRENR